jgi:Tfp pilus assembly protein PilN
MAKDAEIQVREALTLNLRRSSALLNNGTQALAKDASDSVARLVIQFSEVLSEKS